MLVPAVTIATLAPGTICHSFAVDAESFSEEVQMEVLDLQCYTILKQFLSRGKYPKLVSSAAEMMTMFGNTYVCE